jgi:phenylacetate-CoA ligase
MPRLIDRLTDAFKRSAVIDDRLRYRHQYYEPVRKLLRELDTMDRAARRALAERLTARTLQWAARLPDGLPRGVPLAERPIIEKDDVRGHPELFCTPALIRIPAATSGTTGIPVKLVRSLANVAVEQAFIDDLLGVWNYSFRSARVARLRADNVKPQSDREPPFGQYRDGGRQLLLSSNHLSALTVDWYFEALRDLRPDVLFTHPSSGEALARLLQQRGLSLEIPVVLTSSEMLHPAGRLLMESVFNATVIDYYGMAERVVLAAGVAAGAYFFNPAYGRVELLPIASGEAPAGRRAFEIVATGYWNEAMPLARYRSGDRAIVPESYTHEDLDDVCLGLKPVMSIEGRDKEHLISPRGEVIVGLTHAAAGIKGLVRMQVLQDAADRATIRVVVDPRVGRIDEAQLLRNAYVWVPADMRLTVEVVDEMERLPSGKTPFVIRRFATVSG